MSGAAANGSDRIERLAMALLFLTVLYALIGVPDADKHVLHETDYVSPLNRWIWLGLLAMALPILYHRARTVLTALGACWPVLLLYAWFAVSSTWALDPATSSRRVLATCVQLALLLLLVSGFRAHARLHLVVALACALTALAEFLTAVLMPGYAFEPDGFAGLHLQKNVAGMALLYCFLACGSAVLLVRGRRARLGFAAATALTAALLLLTRSSTSMVAAFIMPFVTLALYRLARLSRATTVTFTCVLLMLLASVIFGYFAWCAVTGADPLLPVRDVTFTDRRDLWEFMWDEIRLRPLTGYGFGSFWAIDAAVQPSLKLGAWFGPGTTIINEGHNGYLDLLVTTGCVGLALGLLVLGKTVMLAGRALRRSGPDAHTAVATAGFHMVFLLAFALHNMTESDLFAINPLLGNGFLISMLALQRWCRGNR